MRSINGFTPIRCYDPGTIALVAAIAVGTAGGLAATEAVFGGKGAKAPDVPAQAALPDPNAAAQTALDAQTAQRKALLASGGQTNVTGGGANILGSDIHSLNLTGA